MRPALTAIALTALTALLLILAATQAHAQATQTVQQKVFTGVTTAQASGPVRNIGQSMHLIVVLFPAESATVTGLQIRMEASFDQTLWFPISSDITAATLTGSKVYAMEKAFGPWPFVRVNCVQNTSSKAMTVFYSGAMIPTVSAILQATDRFLL